MLLATEERFYMKNTKILLKICVIFLRHTSLARISSAIQTVRLQSIAQVDEIEESAASLATRFYIHALKQIDQLYKCEIRIERNTN